MGHYWSEMGDHRTKEEKAADYMAELEAKRKREEENKRLKEEYKQIARRILKRGCPTLDQLAALVIEELQPREILVREALSEMMYSYEIRENNEGLPFYALKLREKSE